MGCSLYYGIKRAMTGAEKDIEELIAAAGAEDMRAYLREVLDLMAQARERIDMVDS